MKRVLPVRLTESEIAERGRLTAALSQEVTRLEAELKSVAADYRDRTNGIRERIKALMAEIREEATYVEVETEWRLCFRTNTKELRRLDTGAVIETQALTSEERQGELFVLDGNGNQGEEGGEEEAHAEVG